MASRETSSGWERRRPPATVDGAGLDMAGARSRFSALSRRHNAAPVVYLDGPGGSQTPDAVAHAVARYLTEINANADGPFITSAATARLLCDARVAAADFLGCADEEVIFGANMTSINFLLAHAVARTLGPAMRSWSPSSITTPTWRHGCWSRQTMGWPCGRRRWSGATARSISRRWRR